MSADSKKPVFGFAPAVRETKLDFQRGFKPPRSALKERSFVQRKQLEITESRNSFSSEDAHSPLPPPSRSSSANFRPRPQPPLSHSLSHSTEKQNQLLGLQYRLLALPSLQPPPTAPPPPAVSVWAPAEQTQRSADFDTFLTAVDAPCHSDPDPPRPFSPRSHSEGRKAHVPPLHLPPGNTSAARPFTADVPMRPVPPSAPRQSLSARSHRSRLSQDFSTAEPRSARPPDDRRELFLKYTNPAVAQRVAVEEMLLDEQKIDNIIAHSARLRQADDADRPDTAERSRRYASLPSTPRNFVEENRASHCLTAEAMVEKRLLRVGLSERRSRDALKQKFSLDTQHMERLLAVQDGGAAETRKHSELEEAARKLAEATAAHLPNRWLTATKLVSASRAFEGVIQVLRRQQREKALAVAVIGTWRRFRASRRKRRFDMLLSVLVKHRAKFLALLHRRRKERAIAILHKFFVHMSKGLKAQMAMHKFRQRIVRCYRAVHYFSHANRIRLQLLCLQYNTVEAEVVAAYANAFCAGLAVESPSAPAGQPPGTQIPVTAGDAPTMPFPLPTSPLPEPFSPCSSRPVSPVRAVVVATGESPPLLQPPLDLGSRRGRQNDFPEEVLAHPEDTDTKVVFVPQNQRDLRNPLVRLGPPKRFKTLPFAYCLSLPSRRPSDEARYTSHEWKRSTNRNTERAMEAYDLLFNRPPITVERRPLHSKQVTRVADQPVFVHIHRSLMSVKLRLLRDCMCKKRWDHFNRSRDYEAALETQNIRIQAQKLVISAFTSGLPRVEKPTVVFQTQAEPPLHKPILKFFVPREEMVELVVQGLKETLDVVRGAFAEAAHQPGPPDNRTQFIEKRVAGILQQDRRFGVQLSAGLLLPSHRVDEEVEQREEHMMAIKSIRFETGPDTSSHS